MPTMIRPPLMTLSVESILAMTTGLRYGTTRVPRAIPDAVGDSRQIAHEREGVVDGDVSVPVPARRAVRMGRRGPLRQDYVVAEPHIIEARFFGAPRHALEGLQ